jgi:hypothetical protein
MGRPRLPDEVKRQRGTLRHSRTNGYAPRPRAMSVPPPPRDLSARERAVWARLADEIPRGVFTSSDRTAYRLLVRAVAIAENPERDASHSSRIHYMRLAAAMLQQFGLTPSSRERVSVANRTDAPDDPIAAAMDEFSRDAPLRVVE